MKKFHQESARAEEKSKAAVSGPLSPIQQSNRTKTLVKELLEARQEKLLQGLAAHNRSVEELEGKARDLDRRARRLTQKVSCPVWYPYPSSLI